MSYPSVSVVILNYNGKKNLGEFLLHCLSSVLESDYPNFEVVFVDNGSTDGSVEFVNERFGGNSRLKFLVNKENYGVPSGNNLGIKHATGTYVILLNTDVEVEPSWIKELVKVMEADSNIGVAQSKILSMDRLTIQTVGNLLDPIQQTYLVGHNQKNEGQYDKVFETSYACTAAAIIRRSIFKEIGLLDPKYFVYHEDCELGWKARLAGFKVVGVPSSVVYHKGGATSKRTLIRNQEFFFNLVSRFGLFVKTYEYKNILRFGGLMILSISTDILLRISQGDIFIPLKFGEWMLMNFRHNWKKRLEIQNQIRKVADDKILESFLDSSIFILRIRRHLDRLVSGKLHKHFNRLVGLITDRFYLNHIHKVVEA